MAKWVCFMPSSPAFRFIRATKASSLPLTCRASASQHSAPEGSMAPYSRSRTVTVSPGWNPAMEASALYSAGKMSSGKVTGVSRSGSASVASSTVIILVREAGAASSPDRFRARTCPVRASISSACWLDVPSRIFC